MTWKIKKAEFISGAVGPKGYPKGDLLEIAFAGRSNVGKSSLINKLVNRKGLAKTSSTPGKTRQINFFNINDTLLFVDLPGYGYAKVSKKERAFWGRLISAYLENRKQLRAIVMLFDIRRDPSPEDLSLVEMVFELGIPPIMVLTRSDKIKRGQVNRRKNDIARALDVAPADLVAFSSKTGAGKDEVWRAILEKARQRE